LICPRTIRLIQNWVVCIGSEESRNCPKPSLSLEETMSEYQPASRVTRIKESASVVAAARVRELKSEGRSIIDLTVGEPDFDTPEHIKQAAIQAIVAGETKYTSVTGTPALQAAILGYVERRSGFRYSPKA